MKTVTVLDDYQGIVERLDAARLLDAPPVRLQVLSERRSDEADLIEALRGTHCLVLIRERSRITARVVEALPELELIVQTGRLAGCIDLEACRRCGIEVREGSGNPIAPTELTWTLILAASRRILPYARQLERGRWQRSSDASKDETLGRALHGRSLGVWSLGKIGRRVAAIGRAFGMEILVHGRESSRLAAETAGYEFVAERRAFLGRVDVLSLHLRLTPETRHMITGQDLAAMRTDALLVNTSRAELIAPGALLEALDQGRPGSAALDVFEDEPEGASRYLAHPAVLCTPHLGFVERDTYETYFGQAFAQVREFLQSRA